MKPTITKSYLYEHVARIGKAISSPKRLELIELLAQGEKTVETLAEQARIDTSGVFYMNSGYGSAATAYGCRAWVNFNGTGTVAIRSSGNVSSITDSGTGSYALNFTNALTDTNYAWAASTRASASNYSWLSTQLAGTKTTTQIAFVNIQSTAGTLQDSSEVDVIIFR